MSFINRFLKLKKDQKNSAKTAKERLQIIISHERNKSGADPEYLPAMRQELLEVIRRYVDIDDDQIKVELGEDEGHSILELNVTLPNHSSVEN